MKRSSIQVTPALRRSLERRKLHPRESYEEVIERALRAAEGPPAPTGAPSLAAPVREVLAELRRALAKITRASPPSSHRGLIGAFGERFVKNGAFSKEEGRLLADAHEQRVAADHDAGLRIPPDQAERLLAWARAFVDHAERHLPERTL